MLARVVFAVLVLTTPALAEPVHLTLAQAEEVYTALTSLASGQEVIVKEREGGGERVTRQPYKGWSVATILAMTRDLNELKANVTAWQEARNQRIRELASEDGKMTPAVQRQLAQEIEEQRRTEQSYELTKLKTGDLKVETNQISPAVLSLLMPILVMEQ